MGSSTLNGSGRGVSLAGGLIVAAAVLSWSGAAPAEGLSLRGEGASAPRTTGHYYYPDYARPYYDYRSGAPYTDQLLVIPPVVPILTQPEMFIVDAPPAVSRQLQEAQEQARQQAAAPAAPGQAWQHPAAAPGAGHHQARLQSHDRFQALSQGFAPLPQARQQPAPWHQQPQQSPQAAVSVPYSLHVGSYLVYEDADADEQRIKALGVPTYRRRASVKGIEYVQLHAGPFANHKSAAEAAETLKEALKTPALMQPFSM